MDVIQAEGENGAAQKGDQAVFESRTQNNRSFPGEEKLNLTFIIMESIARVKR